MNAQQLKNAILQEAIQGRLVPQNPNDEPASVLLDRIRKEKAKLVKEGKLKKKDLEEKPISEEEIPFEIPESWEWVRISDIFMINPKVIAEDNKAAAFIPMEKIEACYGSKYTYEIRKWKDIKSSFTCFADGDVAFAKITPCFQNRKSMILRNLPNGIGAGTTELKVLRQFSETIVREYLIYFLASSYFIDEASFKGTANQQRIIVGYLENKPFPLPPLAEQHRIVSKIEELLPKVEEYGKAQEALDKLNKELPERLKKSILQEAIQGRLVPQDPNDESASVLLDRIRKEKAKLVKEGKLKKKDLEEKPISEEEKPFKIPESWEWVRLSSITNKIVDGDHNPPHGIPSDTGFYMLSSKNINHNTIENLTDVRCISFEDWKKSNERTQLAKGDVLLTTVATLGRSCVYENDIPYCFQRSVSVIHTYIFNYYLKYCFDCPYYQSLIDNKSAGTAQRGFYLNQLEDSVIPLPPLAEQQRIVSKIEELLTEIDKLKE